jgi:hypothetical protein
MKGDFVVLRAYDGPVVRRVVEVVGDVVYIASDDQFSLIASGLPSVEPVGFPRRDVFQYDPELEKDISRGKVEWQRLTPYTQKGEG